MKIQLQKLKYVTHPIIFVWPTLLSVLSLQTLQIWSPKRIKK